MKRSFSPVLQSSSLRVHPNRQVTIVDRVETKAAVREVVVVPALEARLIVV